MTTSSNSFQDWDGLAKSVIDSVSSGFEDIFKNLDSKPVNNSVKLLQVQGLLTRLTEETKFWRTPEHKLNTVLLHLVVRRFLKDHQVGFIKRSLIALAVNEVACYVISPEEYQKTYAATRRFYRGLAEVLAE